MARKSKSKASSLPKGLSDVIGILLLTLALLTFVALFSFDRHDLDTNVVPPNEYVHNWAGPLGARLARFYFFMFGPGAFLLPPILVFFGLAFFFELLGYLRRRWIWGVVLVLCCLCFMQVFHPLFMNLQAKVNAPAAGGIIGYALVTYFLSYFGDIGAPIILATGYLVSFIYLTNFDVGAWVRDIWKRRQEWLPSQDVERAMLEAKAKELEREARKLEKEMAKAERRGVKGLIAPTIPTPPPLEEEEAPKRRRGRTRKETTVDVEDESTEESEAIPEPEPMVRDMSRSRASVRKPEESEVLEAEDLDDGEEGLEEGEYEEEEIEVEAEVEETTDPEEELEEVPEEASGDDEPRVLETEEDPEIDEATGEPRASTTAEVLGRDPDAETEDEDGEASGDDSGPAKPKLSDLRKSNPASPAGRSMKVAIPPVIKNYKLPSEKFLTVMDLEGVPTESKESLVANAKNMQSTLRQFGIEVTLGDITRGPTITRFELHPAPGVKLEKIVGLTNNIAAGLKAERINILAPVPGKSSVGVEVPNKIKTKVMMRDLLESADWYETRARIPLALGKDVYGQPIIADLAEMPHLLIAGSTGSGKSVCINSIIASLLLKFPPDKLRFVMIDPKVVELQVYNSLPHLVVPVVTDPKKVVQALKWVITEMEKRYQIFARVGVRNIKSFNERPKEQRKPETLEQELPFDPPEDEVEDEGGFAVELDEEISKPDEEEIVIPDSLSYIVVIIDELADLMLVAPADVEMAIARITQMARAAGIHCIVATQRPSVDVITGVIKANIPARIAFQVAAKVDSRTILDAMGADKLLGKGDMLYLPPGSARLIRAQGVLITDEEIQKIVTYISRQGKPCYEKDILQELSKSQSTGGGESSGGDEDEELIERCIEVIRAEGKASTSLMQRRLRLGYTRAARIMDELENRGIVGPSRGAEPREILVDLGE